MHKREATTPVATRRLRRPLRSQARALLLQSGHFHNPTKLWKVVIEAPLEHFATHRDHVGIGRQKRGTRHRKRGGRTQTLLTDGGRTPQTSMESSSAAGARMANGTGVPAVRKIDNARSKEFRRSWVSTRTGKILRASGKPEWRRRATRRPQVEGGLHSSRTRRYRPRGAEIEGSDKLHLSRLEARDCYDSSSTCER
jgi:hypothetical protein